MMYSFIILSYVLLISHSKPADTCQRQSPCLDIKMKSLEDGNKYGVCMGFDPSRRGCDKSGSISHVCPTGNEYDKIDGWREGDDDMCKIVDCGSDAQFGIKDGKGCRKTAPMTGLTNNDITDIRCEFTEGYCGGGNQEDCTWSVPTPECPKECEPRAFCVCPLVFDPVCCDGRQYSNKCAANCKCAENCVDGPCPKPICPAERPSPGDDCSFTKTCYYGEETCCGQTHPSFGCQCIKGKAACFYTDACLGPCPNECPAEQATPDSICNWEGKCCWGEETCCGQTFDSFCCQCNNGQMGCYYTDSCLGAPEKCEPDCSTVICLKPICIAGEVLVTPDGECCPVCQKAVIDCNAVLCLTPRCNPGEVLVTPDGQCCPVCQKPEIDCSVVLCDEPQCKPGQVLVTPDGECCPQCQLDCSNTPCIPQICDFEGGEVLVTPDDQCCPICQKQCPAEQAAAGSTCDWEGKCCWGEETCCGQTFDSFCCHCNNGQMGCYYTDSCLGAPEKCEPDCSTVSCLKPVCEPGERLVTPDGQCCSQCQPEPAPTCANVLCKGSDNCYDLSTGPVCCDPAICVTASVCAGIGGLPCPVGSECVNDPNNACDPKTTSDCAGICVNPNIGADCLFDGVVYSDGEIIGRKATLCRDDTVYEGTQARCVDGEVIPEPYRADCSTEIPGSTCCQSGTPGTSTATATCSIDVNCGLTTEAPIPSCVPAGATFVGDNDFCARARIICEDGYTYWSKENCGCGCRPQCDVPDGGYFLDFKENCNYPTCTDGYYVVNDECGCFCACDTSRAEVEMNIKGIDDVKGDNGRWDEGMSDMAFLFWNVAISVVVCALMVGLCGGCYYVFRKCNKPKYVLVEDKDIDL